MMLFSFLIFHSFFNALNLYNPNYIELIELIKGAATDMR